ncbi:MAG: tryptophan synthase subunit alpha [Opitutaceae bacterium]|jgi:tryptophan synthase alpha chain|nr:tryptophan synthase subunit alpha [Opitutaceae bacterium]
MDRIAQTFARARSENRACFIAYLCAGDPDFDTSLAAARAVLQNGVDILELGVPFSDPLADGLTNQLAAQRALASGATSESVLALVRRLRAEFPGAPLVFYTYYNLVFTHGVDTSVRRAREAGLDAMLVLDLPPEESGEFAAACARHGLKTVLIVAPTTPDARIEIIGRAATGFIYYASREGVTGVRDQLAAGIPQAVARIKARAAPPVAVGFGLSTRAHVAAVAAHADGAVVGSALVNCIRDHLDHRENIPAVIGAKARDLSAGVYRAPASA